MSLLLAANATVKTNRLFYLLFEFIFDRTCLIKMDIATQIGDKEYDKFMNQSSN